MKSSQNKFFLLNGIGLLISIIYSTFLQKHFLLTLIDAYFMIGLFYFCAGASLYVIGGGFFSVFSYSMKKFWKKTSKKEEYVSELEDESEQTGPNMEILTFSWTSPLLYSGFFSCVFTFICSIIFFG
jgi:hypothetical protein